MVPFVIVASLRTGSTLLSSSLDRHPNVRCYGELFHPQDLSDNQLPGQPRHEYSGRELIQRVLDAGGARAVGFRAMVFLPLPSQPQWADAWDCLRTLDRLRVIYLARHDRLAQYASVRIAHQTGSYHPPPSDPLPGSTDRPTITIDPGAFRRWTERRDQLYAQRRWLLREKPSLDLDYETLTTSWVETTRRVQEFLDVGPIPLEQAKKKQETRPLAEVIANYDQIASRIRG